VSTSEPNPVITGERPPLLLVAVDMGPRAGSEPGKAWEWACALARYYRLHVVTGPAAAERCRREDIAADWQWHTTRLPVPYTTGWRYYRDYSRWCAEIPSLICEVQRVVRAVALHHITLGSFRVLPRYDRCGVVYSLGPLGGGEFTPREFLATARLPVGSRLAELARPWLNNACAAVPSLRAVMRNSALALATSRETEIVLRRMGARQTAVVCPDRVPEDVDPTRAQATEGRAADLRRCVRLIWSGRALWWKGGQLAVELLRRLIAQGVQAELAMFSYGPALHAWRRQIEEAGVAKLCRVSGFVSRPERFEELGWAHAVVYPTFHDSSSPALLEAYAMGLPSLTVGLGGAAFIARADTGHNVRPENLDTWLDGAVACVQRWQQEPSTWIAASNAARARAAEFGEEYLETMAGRWLGPRALAR
jgi:glycosyltransferase involved in cell wall biosynthesis